MDTVLLYIQQFGILPKSPSMYVKQNRVKKLYVHTYVKKRLLENYIYSGIFVTDLYFLLQIHLILTNWHCFYYL